MSSIFERDSRIIAWKQPGEKGRTWDRFSHDRLAYAVAVVVLAQQRLSNIISGVVCAKTALKIPRLRNCKVAVTIRTSYAHFGPETGKYTLIEAEFTSYMSPFFILPTPVGVQYSTCVT